MAPVSFGFPSASERLEIELEGLFVARRLCVAQGRIEEFEVMVRPMSGLQALAARMAAELAPAYATLTGKDVPA